MTRHDFHHILETPIEERRKNNLPVFEWEYWSKSFQCIPNDLAMKHFMELYDSKEGEDRIILKCKYNSDVYYFGVGLKDCDNINMKKLKKLYKSGTWFVYTWCD